MGGDIAGGWRLAFWLRTPPSVILGTHFVFTDCAGTLSGGELISMQSGGVVLLDSTPGYLLTVLQAVENVTYVISVI